MTISFKQFLSEASDPRQATRTQASDAHEWRAAEHGGSWHDISRASYAARKKREDELKAKGTYKSDDELRARHKASQARKEAKQKEMRAVIIAMMARKAAAKKK